MNIIETIGGGFMMTGLVLGAMTGAIALLLVPMAIGAAIISISSWYKHWKKVISYRVPYPPYRY